MELSKADLDMFKTLAATCERQTIAAKAMLLLATDDWVVVSQGEHWSVLQVISETPANTSINFAGNPETVKIFRSAREAGKFMDRFEGIECKLLSFKAYLEHTISVNEDIVSRIKEKGYY